MLVSSQLGVTAVVLPPAWPCQPLCLESWTPPAGCSHSVSPVVPLPRAVPAVCTYTARAHLLDRGLQGAGILSPFVLCLK